MSDLKALRRDWEDAIEYDQHSCNYILALEARLKLVEAAVQHEKNDGFGNYMTNITRALKGKSPKKRQVRR